MRDKKVNILIAEDDLIMARLQKFSLERLICITPVLCRNGREAIDYLDSIARESDLILVLLDLNMPDMNGWEFLEACKQRPYSKKVHVVVITSSLFREDQKKAKTYEQVIGYFTKPVNTRNCQEILNLPEVAGAFETILKDR